MLHSGRAMTTSCEGDDFVAGPSSARGNEAATSKFDMECFDINLCYAPAKENPKIELCKTLLLIADTHMSTPLYERGPSDKKPLPLIISAEFRASYYLQITSSYENLKINRYTGRPVCGISVDAIKEENAYWCMKR